MTEWILSSSILIIIILMLRALLKGKIDPRLQYALWLLVLLRLLLPVSLVKSEISAAGLIEEAGKRQTASSVLPKPADGTVAGDTRPDPIGELEEDTAAEGPAGPQEVEATTEPTPEKAAQSRFFVSTGFMLYGLWLLGAAGILLASFFSNRLFGRRLRKEARPLPGKWTVPPRKIYISAAPGAPCLFGLASPAIFVPESIAVNDLALGHVLSHERAHYRHKDHVWSALRILALALHWYNPLVWWACALSRRDAEAAADAAAIAALGEKERTDYGLTLVSLVSRASRPGDLLSVGTTMFGSRRTIRERVKLIAKRPRTAVTALLLALLICAAAVRLTYAGPVREKAPAPSALPASISLPAGTSSPAPERVSLPSQWFADEEAFLDFINTERYAGEDYTGAGYKKLSVEEYQTRYGYTLAQSELLPQRYKLYDRVLTYEYEDGAIRFGRLWYDPVSFDFLEIWQTSGEGPVSTEDDGVVTFESLSDRAADLGRGIGYATCLGSVHFQAGNWYVTGVMYVNDPLQEYECRRILETITLENVRPLDLNQYETVDRSEGSLRTQTGSFDYDARLRRQPRTDWQGDPYWVYTCDVRFYRAPSGQYFQQLGFVPSSGVSGQPVLQADVADVNGDGSEDLVFSLSDGSGWRFVACWLYSESMEAFIRAERFFGIAGSVFDPGTGLFQMTIRGNDGTFTSYDLYRIEGSEPTLYKRLTVDRAKPAEQRYSEYSFLNGRVTTLVEDGPVSAIDTETWAFALN